MRKLHLLFFPALIPCLLLWSCASRKPAPAPATAAVAPPATNRPPRTGPDFIAQPVGEAARFVSASSAAFRYEGRIDFADSKGPVFIWQGTRMAIDFQGRRLALRLDCLEGQSFFDVTLDGTKYLLPVRGGTDQRYLFQGELGPGRHHLTLFKRSEAIVGQVRFRGIELEAGADVWRPAPPDYRMRMEFIGDSITVGACDEDGDADQWDDRQTHNNALSYGCLTAGAFSADYRNIAVSGMGVTTGWVDVRAGQIWDRLYPKVSSVRAGLDSWKPDVVFVNLGENDDAYTHAHGQPFPANFTADYILLVRAIRDNYPEARIVLLRGGMYGGAQSIALRDAWEAAVKRLEAADPAIYHFVFTHWTENHPRVRDHREMADELIQWLKAQDFMKTAGHSN